jgi:exodeoxyribonuclease VII small subunit
MNRKPKAESGTVDFETSLLQLEELVARLERGDLPLAEALGLFEQGVSLTRSCHTALSEAQQKVEILLKEGTSERIEPFDTAADSRDE